MFSRFFRHALVSCKQNYLFIVHIACAYTLMSALEYSDSGVAIALSLAAGIAAIIFSFSLALRSHHTTLSAERPDVALAELGAYDRVRFLKVALGVNLLAYFPLIIGGAVFVSTIEDSLTGIIANETHFQFWPFAIVGVLGVGAIGLFVALGPFIPRTLSTLNLPLKQQILINLANWKRALVYLLICALGTSLVIFAVTETLIYSVGNDILYFVLTFLAEILTTCTIVLFATAFSMHFLDTIAQDAG